MGIYSIKECQDKVLNEVYFGYTSGIARCFEAFQAFRSKYVTNRKFFTFNINAEKDPDLKVFVEEVEREFGIHSFSFIIEDNDTPNMCTLPVLFRFKSPQKSIIVSKTGYKFKPEAKISVICIAYTGLLFNNNFTDRELFAIFLHEMGHNFSRYINGHISTPYDILETLQLMCSVFDIINLANGKERIPHNLIRVLTRNNIATGELSKIYNKITIEDKNVMIRYFNFIRGIVLTFYNNITTIPYILTMPINLIVSGFYRLIGTLLSPELLIYGAGYMDERTADNFPAYYGFGPDIVSANQKMGDNSKVYTGCLWVVMNCPIIGHIFNLSLIPAELILSISDIHPRRPERILGVIDALEQDSNDPRLSPKLRKELKEQLKQVKKQTQDYFNEASKIENPGFATNAMDAFIFYCLKGDLKYKFFDKTLRVNREINDNTYKLMDTENPISSVKIK